MWKLSQAGFAITHLIGMFLPLGLILEHSIAVATFQNRLSILYS